MKKKITKHNPYKIVKMFEEEMAFYTGAKYAVSVDSCTNAIFLCLMYQKHMYEQLEEYSNRVDTAIDIQPLDYEINIPSKTYLSVPMSIIHAGFRPVFDKTRNDWEGLYKLTPYQIYDSAKRLTSDMYIDGTYMCLSFHMKKTLGIGKGGMILTDNEDAFEWFKKARYEGRGEKLYHEDNIEMLGWNMYMTPQQAAHGLALMQNYDVDIPDLGEKNGYKDLTENNVFKKYKVIENEK